MKLSIVPLDVGTFWVNKSLVTPRRDFDVTWQSCSVIWYIEGAEKKIIVDTSWRSTEEAAKVHVGFRIERTPKQEIKTALSRVGLTPEDIDVVILTHLHWDHSQNTALFKNASVVVQREEMRYAIAPLPNHRIICYEPIAMKPYWLETPRFEIVTGDRQIVPGVSVIATPGHSPGYQCVVVDTEQGKIVIAGCMIPTFQNWGSSALGTHIPGGLFVNLQDYWNSLEKIESITNTVLPGHDPSVFKKERYT